MKSFLILTAGCLLAVSNAACQTQGVTSNYRSQWTNVDANVKDTTEASRTVLEDEGLKNVTASSTNVDGKATGKKADGATVNVAVERKTKETSQVSVTVGKLGDPSLGADIAKKIKNQAEGGTSTTRPSHSSTRSSRASTRSSSSD
ncbi:MAG TPA: DUF3568 family protein [Tepidisphaeraceae bacterium]|jgi:hypothetical protein